MTRVIIHTRASGDAFVSRWLCGNRSGEVTTALPPCCHPRAQAELQALCHLTVHKRLIGLDSGVAPLTFCVSEPLVAQAVKDPLGTPELRLRSRALRARFGDALFEQCDMPPALLPGAELSLLAVARAIDFTVMINGLSIVVTEHAVKQVQQRHRFKNRGYAYRFLRRWAKRHMSDAVLPPAVVSEKLSKYQTPGLIKCDDTGWHGVIVNGTLVTMFYRDTRN